MATGRPTGGQPAWYRVRLAAERYCLIDVDCDAAGARLDVLDDRGDVKAKGSIADPSVVTLTRVYTRFPPGTYWIRISASDSFRVYVGRWFIDAAVPLIGVPRKGEVPARSLASVDVDIDPTRDKRAFRSYRVWVGRPAEVVRVVFQAGGGTSAALSVSLARESDDCGHGDFCADTVDGRAEIVAMATGRPAGTFPMACWYIDVYATGQSALRGRLTVQALERAKTPGYSPRNPLPLQLGSGAASVATAEGIWYQVTVPRRQIVSFEIDAPQISIDVFNEIGERIAAGQKVLGEIEGGTYAVRVRAHTGSSAGYGLATSGGPSVDGVLDGNTAHDLRVPADGRNGVRQQVQAVIPFRGLRLSIDAPAVPTWMRVRPARTDGSAEPADAPGQWTAIPPGNRHEVPISRDELAAAQQGGVAAFWVDVIAAQSVEAGASLGRVRCLFDGDAAGPGNAFTFAGLRFLPVPSAQDLTLGAASVGSDGTPAPDPDAVVGAEPRRSFRPSPGLLMSATEVTQYVQHRVMDGDTSPRAADGRSACGFSPDAAEAFCRELTRLANKEKLSYRFRLPTEDEWEYACRAGTQTPIAVPPAEISATSKALFKDRLASFAWYSGHKPRNWQENGPFDVAGLRPNPLQFYDFHGNVSEICTRSPALPTSVNGDYAMRGGAWNTFYAQCRSSSREGIARARTEGAAGLRVVAVPK